MPAGEARGKRDDAVIEWSREPAVFEAKPQSRTVRAEPFLKK